MKQSQYITPTPERAEQVALQLVQRFPALAAQSGRIRSAVAIAATPGAVDGCDLDGYTVRSQSNQAGSYTVRFASHSCTCPDHGKHAEAGIVCKHRLAAYIWKQTQPAPVVDQLPHQGEQGIIRAKVGRYWRELVVEIADVRADAQGPYEWLVKVLSTDGSGQPIPALRMYYTIGNEWQVSGWLTLSQLQALHYRAD